MTNIISILEKNHKVLPISIDLIKTNLYDFRNREEEHKDRESEEFQQLKQSIEEQGIVTPVHLAPDSKRGNGYQLIDGRRRLLAVKLIGGIKTIPAIVIENKTEEYELATITLNQNIHQKNLNAIEKARGIVKLFELYGYDDIGKIKQNLKRLHNNHPSTVKEVPQHFINVFKGLGWNANYVYALVHTIETIPEKTLKKAEEYGLKQTELSMLTHSKLQKHPAIQDKLVNEIAKRDNKSARELVHKTINDLETGHLTKDDDGSYFYGDSRGEDSDFEIVKQPMETYLDLVSKSNSFLKTITGHTLSKGEFKYIEKHVDSTEEFRKAMINSLDKRSALALEDQLHLLIKSAKSTLEIIAQVFPH